MRTDLNPKAGDLPEGTVYFPERTLYAESGHFLEPFITPEGQIGYIVKRPESDFTGAIYFNPELSTTPAAWVYMGTTGDPANAVDDLPQHFYALDIPADYMDESDWIEAGRPE